VTEQTYHGVPIPDDLWEEWNDPNASEVSGFRRGVWAALNLLGGEGTDKEDARLKALAEARDAADRAAFEEKHKDEPWMQRRLAFRKEMEDRTSD